MSAADRADVDGLDPFAGEWASVKERIRRELRDELLHGASTHKPRARTVLARPAPHLERSAPRPTPIADTIAIALDELQVTASPAEQLEVLERELLHLLATSAPKTNAAHRQSLVRVLRHARRELMNRAAVTTPLS